MKRKNFTDDELLRIYEEHDEIGEAVREWMRESDSSYVGEQMDELRGVIAFEVDAWDNVYANPRVTAAGCGDMAEAVRGSIYSYPDKLEDALCALERYAEGVDRLGGSIWSIPDRFEEAIDKRMQEVCDVYADDMKACLNAWWDYDDEELCARFMEEPEMWLEHVGLDDLMYVADFDGEDETLGFFMDGGVMLDKRSGTVYIADVNADGDFFGVMVGWNTPIHAGAHAACEYALENFPAPGTGAECRMGFMEAPGGWFTELVDDMKANPCAFETAR